MLTQSALPQEKATPPTFGDDVEFLKKYVHVIVLADASGQRQVAVIPEYQGRIMTSTAAGSRGLSYGWVNRDLIASRKVAPHINVFGGEDRFWLGPEGGQFSIFFAKGNPFDLEHWFTPASIDTEPYEVLSKSRDRVVCRKPIELVNYSGTKFQLEVNRELRLLEQTEAKKHLGAAPASGVNMVAFESVNSIKNTGRHAWRKESGLLSIWILGMFNAAPATTVVVPFRKGLESTLGPIVNDSYFGKVPPERLMVKDGVLFFAADASYRSKIGVSPKRALPTLGSYDAVHHVLTIAQYTLPAGATEYVNSMWEMQKEPFGGDAVNSYNDGPQKPGGTQLGKFYELETSSPALALQPGGSATHVHRTIHLQGSEQDLDPIARSVLGVSIAEIKIALKR
ncbi:MAG TPA: hypothetical protein DCP63_10270 [Bacteroidetes bacterium]|nr:hypothetical protein [Bacteroidota bacterium]